MVCWFVGLLVGWSLGTNVACLPAVAALFARALPSAQTQTPESVVLSYVLCTPPEGSSYENSIYATADVQSFKCEVTFTADTFARSFVRVDDVFYVGLGCERPGENGPKPSTSTGDILRVVLNRWSSGLQSDDGESILIVEFW